MIKRATISLVILCYICIMAGDVSALPPDINIIYPKQNSDIGASDSTFIFGSVSPGAELKINGFSVDVHPEGGFIAFLPLEPGNFKFKITAVKDVDTAFLEWPVNVPRPMKSLDFDSLVIIDRMKALGNLTLTENDRLIVEFQGTPGCNAYFSVPGYTDSVPMAEIEPQLQPYWGESVFGVGAVPDSLKIRGFYRGFIDIDDRSLPDSCRVQYHLEKPDYLKIIRLLVAIPDDQFDYNILDLLKLEDSIKTDSSKLFVKINPSEYPRLIKFTDSVQIVRVGPRKGYFSIFQPEGVKALAVGAEGDWLKLRLSQYQQGWVNANSVMFLESGLPPPVSYVKSVRMYSSDENAVVEIPLANRHPFRVKEEDKYTISIYIYGVKSDTDWIRYDIKDDILEQIAWFQDEPDVYHLKFYFKCPVWGYEVFYESNILKFKFNKPPQDIDRIKNKIIVIDPGHSSDPGAIGPTGLTEARANLDISLELMKQLNKRGAKVIMTREGMSDLPLYDRPGIARAADADLFVSIHNNALPDGVNPFENNGISAYYYHLHSIDLARAIHDELIERIDLPSHGLYYGNLAVNRPTQYPAVLVECAFIILPEQEAMLKSKKYHKKFATAIRKGIEKFLKEYECE